MNKLTNLLTLADVQNVQAAEAENIKAKSFIRTQALAEKFYPAKPADTRPVEVLDYNVQSYDNDDSPLYGDLSAAAIWASLKGIKFDAKLFTHEDDGEQELQLARGVVIVPVDTRTFQWPDDFKKEPVMLTQVGTRHSGWFRNAAGEKVCLPGTPTTLNVRPATLDEIAAVVDGNMAVRPIEFIRNMGDTITSADTGSTSD